MKPYRILVTGSRDWADMDCVYANIATAVFQHVPAVIVHGACPTGADAQAAWWVRMHGRTLGVTEERHPAQGHPTKDFGPWPGAGPRRNRRMVDLGADLCLAFIGPCTSPRCRRPDPHPSHGASGCADLAEKAGIPTQRFTA
ncbi:SLOG family protein [Streptomyces sp. NPDC059534]|uniref:SLOG family protein n=1 Tax=Streptomyces sp. NPDC059534 TaxID=3346859 RepID=UPI00368AE3F5